MGPLSFNSYINFKQSNEESVDAHRDLTYTCDILSTELEKAMNASFCNVGVLPVKKRWLSNEQKTALSKHKLQQASSAVKDKLKKKHCITLDHGSCGGSKNLKLIHLQMKNVQNPKLEL
jgi:hypothetical protein